MYNTLTFSNNMYCKKFIFDSTFLHNQNILSRCKQPTIFSHIFVKTFIETHHECGKGNNFDAICFNRLCIFFIFFVLFLIFF